MKTSIKTIIFSMIILVICSYSFPTSMTATAIPIPSIHIIIDPGHGGVDSGAASNQVEEKEINLAIARELQSQLERRGYTSILTRERDEALSDSSPRKEISSRHRRDLVQRGDIAKHFYPKLLISLHVNSGSSMGSGALVLYQKNGLSYLYAHILQTKLNEFYQQSNNPIPRKNLFLLNQSKNPAVLVEIGFISNPAERAALLTQAFQNKLAAIVAESVDEFITVFPWYVIDHTIGG